MPSSHILQESSRFEGTTKGHFRLVLMGAAAVGKTAIVHRFLYDAFPHHYSPTVEELYRGEYEVGSRPRKLILDILDTSGSYEFPAMRRLAVETGDAFVLVYAIDDQESFDEVARLKDMLSQLKGKRAPIVVVGNKSDLERRRVVRRELADTLVALDWEDRFVETSAKENVNVVEIFKEVLLQANFPHELNPARQKRRTSLPLYALPIMNTKSNKNKRAKRNSCAVS